MELGTFSFSLAVKDIQTSLAFYAKLGFHIIGGEAEQNWLILQNGNTQIGLFQGMFEENILTWNPKDLAPIKETLHANAVKLVHENDKHVMFRDPDGNLILIDQHKA
ncbi:MAG TPA: VOC family protein [Bacteroidetes bacterium]|nr:VOC family protein [Bacteroidota bacterium]